MQCFQPFYQVVLFMALAMAFLLPGTAGVVVVEDAVGELSATGTAHVKDGFALAAAFANNSINLIIIEANIRAEEEQWSMYGGPVIINRTVVLRGSDILDNPPLVDFNGIKNKATVMPDLVIAMENVIVLNYRAGLARAALGMDFLTPSPPPGPGQGRPIMRLRNGAQVQRVCVIDVRVYVLFSQRPPEVPGKQSAEWRAEPPPGCVNDTSAPLLKQCWARWGVTTDLAAPAQYIDAVGNSRPANYIVHVVNSTVMCIRTVSEDCMKNNSAIVCWARAIKQLEEDEAAAAAAEAAAAAAGGPRPATVPGSLPEELAELGLSLGLSQAPKDSDSSGASPQAPLSEGGVRPSLPETATAAAGSPSPPAQQQGQSLPPPPQQQQQSSAHGQGGGVPLYVVLPAALGGATVLAAVALAAVSLQRRRLQRQQHAQLEVKLDAASNPPTHRHTQGGVQGKPQAPAGEGKGAASAGKAPISLEPSDGYGVRSDAGDSAAVGFSSSGVDPASSSLAAAALTAEAVAAAAAAAAAAATAASDSCSMPSSLLIRMVTERSPLAANVRLDLRLGHDVTVCHDALRGAGAFGRVVEGEYQGARVAVKLLHAPTQRSKREPALACLRAEVNVMSRCSHPHVVALLGACLEPPTPFLVMELMDQSLEQLLEQHGPANLLPLERVLSIALDVATSLAYLHPTVTHRDLKPANVLLGALGGAKVSDFGLARLRDTVQATKHPQAGTAPYMAPECFVTTDNVITHKADLYSWAVLVWEMLAGQRPWHGFTPIALAFSVASLKLRPSLAALTPARCPARLRALIHECWDEDPLRRPSAEEVAKRVALIMQQIRRNAISAAATSASAPVVWPMDDDRGVKEGEEGAAAAAWGPGPGADLQAVHQPEQALTRADEPTSYPTLEVMTEGSAIWWL